MLVRQVFRGFSFLRVKMYVYFIQEDNDRGRVKIGVAKDPKKRLRQHQTSSPSKLRLIYCFRHEDAREVERALHEMFAPYRSHGEWFNYGQALRMFVENRFVPNIYDGSIEAEQYIGDLAIVMEEEITDAPSGWRLERNSNSYFRWRWQVKDDYGRPVTYDTEGGGIGYKRGSQYVPIAEAIQHAKAENPNGWIEYQRKGTKNPKRYACLREWIKGNDGNWVKSAAKRLRSIPPLSEEEYRQAVRGDR